MAEATLTVAACTLNGATPSFTAGTADGAKCLNETGDTFLLFVNAAASVRSWTLTAQGASEGGANYANEAQTIPASTSKLYGPFERAAFNDSTNYIHWTYQAGVESTLSVQALKCTRTLS